MRILAGLLLLAACRPAAPSRTPATEEARFRPVAPAKTSSVPAAPDATDTLPPQARPGALVTRAAGPNRDLDGEWTPRAGVCRTPARFELLAQNDSVDVLVLLERPADSAAAGGYPVAGPDSVATGRVSRIGVQRLQYVDLAYRGVGGAVWLDRLDRAATGRLDVTLEEITSHLQLRYRGVFTGIPVDTLDEPACRAARPDTVRRAPRGDSA